MKSSEKSKKSKYKCQSHKKSKNLPYIQWFADAEKRTSKGEQQIFCSDCNKWIWATQLKNNMKKNENN